MERSDIINRLIKNHDLKSYLEIGLNEPGRNFTKIKCQDKESCDPFFYDQDETFIDNESCFIDEFGTLRIDIMDNLTYRMTSDALFAMMPYDKKWDIIFIDGLHLHEQVTKDILNSLKHLNRGGFIVVHDCLPEEEVFQNRNRTTEKWNGDVWKAVARLGELGLNFYTMDTDQGVGIIPYQEINNIIRERCFYTDYLTWEYLQENRDELMHVINSDSIGHFLDNI